MFRVLGPGRQKGGGMHRPRVGSKATIALAVLLLAAMLSCVAPIVAAGSPGGGARDPRNTETPPPVTTAVNLSAAADSGWLRSPQTVILSATDDGGPGVAATYYTLNGGAQQTYAGPFTISDGANAVAYWSVDTAGNTEPSHTGYANIDTVAPTSSVGPLRGGWSKKPVTLAFSAVDVTSRVASIEYRRWLRMDWEKTWTTYSAPFLVTREGVSTYQYRSTDLAGNVELANILRFGIDTRPPVTKAFPASVKPGKRVWLSYEVLDARPGCDDAHVTMKFFKGKQLRRSFVLGSCIVNAKLSFRWQCTLARGIYTIRVFAKDDAGNVQALAEGAKLTVR
jgi:Chitobiase/beta-hexosaminidase C-terminal domain